MAFRLVARKPTGGGNIVTSSTNITTSAYVEYVTALGKACTAIQFNNGTDKTLILATGAAGSEVDTGLYLYPGISPLIPIEIAKGKRVALKSLSGTASSGAVTMNFLGG